MGLIHRLAALPEGEKRQLRGRSPKALRAAASSCQDGHATPAACAAGLAWRVDRPLGSCSSARWITSASSSCFCDRTTCNPRQSRALPKQLGVSYRVFAASPPMRLARLVSPRTDNFEPLLCRCWHQMGRRAVGLGRTGCHDFPHPLPIMATSVDRQDARRSSGIILGPEKRRGERAGADIMS